MAALNVHITGAPEKPQRVDCCAADAGDWAELGIIFPSFRLTDPAGHVNFVSTTTPLPEPMAIVFACEKAVSDIITFDGTTDVTVTLAYAPFKSGVGPIPVLPRPPLPLPLPNPTRDADVWATVLPWDAAQSSLQAAPASFSGRIWTEHNLRIFHQLRKEQLAAEAFNRKRPQPMPMAAPAQTSWTSAPVDRNYLRGDAWGIVMPGAPMIDGASAETPDQILSWFLDRYPLDFQHAYLAKTVGYGYTHLYLSPPDSLNGAGKSLEEFVDTCRLVKSYGLYVGLNMASKYFQPRDMDPDQFAAYIDPLLDVLLDEADEFVPAWEWDLWNRTAPDAITIQRHIGQRCHAKGKSCWLHFGPHTTSWFADGDPRGRFGYWDDLQGDVDGINYQTFPTWTTQEMCDRMVDTLWQFGEGGNLYKMRLWEDQATAQYHGDATPDDGDARGYYGCCTFDNVKGSSAKIWGFGNGGRRPDGTRI